MQTVVIRNLTIGAGIPKICVPIVGVTKEEIVTAAQKIRESKADFTEWRADWFTKADDLQKVKEILTELRGILNEMPLLCTFRTKQEGGEKPIGLQDYTAFYESVVQTGLADLIDAELSAGEAAVRQLVAAAHANGVKVIASNHNFSHTPQKAEIIQKLCSMQELGADLLKIAVMPHSSADVLTLLSATEQMRRESAKRPVITMAMGAAGVISRICGETFGSAVTFAAVGKTSAPGQMQVEELAQILSSLHHCMG